MGTSEKADMQRTGAWQKCKCSHVDCVPVYVPTHMCKCMREPGNSGGIIPQKLPTLLLQMKVS